MKDCPDWKRMVADIEAGKVGAVLVKDMSRIGRNYLQTGFYTEVFFRERGVHFIAIANNVDNEDQASSEFAPFLSIVNEWYLRDQSRKVEAAARVKGNSGKPLTNIAVYGYVNDTEDHDHWLVDEEAAQVVRRIFSLAAEGHGPYEIARMLTGEMVRVPFYEVAYLDVQQNYVTVHGKEAYTVKRSLKEFEDELDARFFRAGRGLILNLDHVRRVTRTEVTLDTGEKLPLPRGAYDPLNRAIIEHH